MLFVLGVLFTACSGGETHKSRNANFLPPMHITITDEIKGDPDLVTLVTSSEKAINEFSDNIEQLAVDGKDLLQKSENGEEASMMDKLKAGKMMLEFASNSTQMLTTMQKFTTYMEEKQAQGMINEQQVKALEQVGKAFNNRIEAINKKYADYFSK